jgi:hypothetical protein
VSADKDVTWSAAFDEPIALPEGRKLETLLDAGDYIAGLSPAMQRRPEWQAATEALLLVAGRNGPTMLARIGVMRALNRHFVPELNPKGKEPHWGRRKLKREQCRSRQLRRPLAPSADDLCSRDKHTEDDSGDGEEGGKIPNAMHAEITAMPRDGSGQAPRPV